MVNMRTAVVTVILVFSSSRNAALFERKVLQNTTLSIKFYHCTLSEVKIQVFTLSDVLALVSIHCADQKQHSNHDFLTKSIENTLQLCVDTANENLQAYNTGADVKNHLFGSLHHCKKSRLYNVFVCICYLSLTFLKK